MKGQTAIEYLMTYGWAILIILIVAGVLAYYGIFAPGSFLGPSSKGFVQVAVLSPWSLDTTGTLMLQAENRVGQDIIIRNISADTGTGGATIVCECKTPCTGGVWPTTTIGAGARYPSSGFMNLNCTGTAGGSSGASYTISVKIVYTVGTETTPLFSSSGTLSGSRS